MQRKAIHPKEEKRIKSRTYKQLREVVVPVVSPSEKSVPV